MQGLANLGLWLALGLIAPFQMGAGFGLYLNRRTRLEAWDLEIAFRRLRARIAPGVASLAAVSPLALAGSVYYCWILAAVALGFILWPSRRERAPQRAGQPRG